MSNSNSSGDVSLLKRVRYLWHIFIMKIEAGTDASARVALLREELNRLTMIAETRAARPASQLKVVEIGFGALPLRAHAMAAEFGEVIAIDLERPLIGLSNIPELFRTNGFLRALKSAVRFVLFDRAMWASFARAMPASFPRFDLNKAQLIVGDASLTETWRGIDKLDLVISTSVFEHIPASGLLLVLEEAKSRLSDRGMIVAQIDVFTGITGGHDPDWYGHRVANNATGTAWAHLRNPDFEIDTYLNRMTRRDYVSLFEKAGLTILRDDTMLDDVGREHLTGSVAEALAGWDDYELFSNKVEFWLEPQNASA
jgi:hypothetical protein